MGNSRILVGPDGTGRPSPANAEAAAFEYFHNRVFAGALAPKPPVEKWRNDDRRRFEKELERLESERTRQSSDAVRFIDR